MKQYLILALIAVAGASLGVAIKTIVAAHTAAANPAPPATTTTP